MDNNFYQNPLITRYASSEMAKVFSDDAKIKLWRKLWIVLAESQKELGLNITDEQISELKRYQNDINWKTAQEREKIVRHDVMAHVYAYGEKAKSAKPIIHLGATSCYVTDNAEIIMIYNALEIVKKKLITLINSLSSFALKYKDLVTLGFTHFQAAQPTTVGKRTSLWIQDLILDFENLEFLTNNIKLRGVKGTTGTQASFLKLFDGNSQKVVELEKLVLNKLGFEAAYGVTGQTYTRKFDYSVLSALSMIAQSAYKFANDLRLLQHLKEIEEPFEKEQIGSSAMAYKRNPMRSERICALARFVLSLPINASMTASTQWFERTLDDSANKRIVIPQAFLAIDGALNLYLNIAENMVVYENMIKKHLDEELPFMATEEILMECVAQGGDRQELHEKIRQHSLMSAIEVKQNGNPNDLLKRIANDPSFVAVKDKLDVLTDAKRFAGRAAEQVEEFYNNEVKPLIEKNKKYLGAKFEVKV
ncbi:MAG TPA: adenylosuccinate lyase [Clostridiales bacterium]|nr:adenylosuccinate lyase [Clostridiales bacterium]